VRFLARLSLRLSETFDEILCKPNSFLVTKFPSSNTICTSGALRGDGRRKGWVKRGMRDGRMWDKGGRKGKRGLDKARRNVFLTETGLVMVS
jgi:hypothetical protein